MTHPSIAHAPAPSAVQRSSHIGSLGLVAAVVVGALLRSHCFLFRYLWLDEFVTLWSIDGKDYSEMLQRAMHWTASGPLFVLCYRIACDVLGHADWALKVPGVLSGTLIIWAVWWVVRELFDRRDAALAAAWLVALGPQFIHFSQEARPYMPAVLLVTLSMGCLAAWIRTERRLALAACAIFCLGGIGFHLLAALAIPAQNAAVLLHAGFARWPRRRWTQWVVAQLLLIACFPVAGVQFHMLSGRRSSMIFETALAMPTRQNLDRDLSSEIRAQALIVLIGIALWLCARKLPRSTLGIALARHAQALRLVALWYMIPTLMLTVLSMLRVVDNWPRYYFLFLPGLVIASAWIAVCPFPRALSATLLAAMVLGMLSEYNWIGGVPSCRFNTAWMKFSDARSELYRRTGPEDLVLSRSGLIESNQLSFLGNARGASYLKCFLETPSGPLAAQHIPLPFSPESPAMRQYLESLATALQNRSDFWLVNTGPTDFDYRPWIEQRLGDRFQEMEELDCPIVLMCHYVARENASGPTNGAKKGPPIWLPQPSRRSCASGLVK